VARTEILSRLRRPLVPLVLSTIAAQASIVVLVPIVVEVGHDLNASVSAVGQARTVLATTAVVAALFIGPLIDRLGVRPLLAWGSALGIQGAVLSAIAPSLALFLAAHVLTGVGVACLLSAGFAGVGAWFPEGEMARPMGFVVGAQSISWIVGNPIIGIVTEAASWRYAYLVPGTVCAAAFTAALLSPIERDETGQPAPSREGLRAVLRDRSARRWTLAELVAYSAWTAELTYIGAFYIQTYDVSEATVGFLLAVGSIAFAISTLSTAALTARFRRRALIWRAALGMGAMLAVIMNVTPAVAVTVCLFFLMALLAGVRSTASSGLGLDQLPAQPGSMMAARTASAQLGYMLGAVVGGTVLALADFGALGFVLLAGMAISAVLIARVADPTDLRPEWAHEQSSRPPPVDAG
jgi:predicted MFS family arabinose efflux permease